MSELTSLIAALRVWSDDDQHRLRSARFYEPTFRNPDEIRAAVRGLLAAYDEQVESNRRLLRRCQEAESSLAAELCRD